MSRSPAPRPHLEAAAWLALGLTLGIGRRTLARCSSAFELIRPPSRLVGNLPIVNILPGGVAVVGDLGR